MQACNHVPITTTLQDLFKIEINNFSSNQFNLSQIRYDTIILDKETIETFFLKEALMIKKHAIVELWLQGILKSFSCFDCIKIILFNVLFILLISSN